MKQCNADSLTKDIATYFEENDISIAKVAGLGSDGASVMVGRHNGIGAKLKKQNPFMLSMHCVAHKLALASQSDAASWIEVGNLIAILYLKRSTIISTPSQCITLLYKK